MQSLPIKIDPGLFDSIIFNCFEANSFYLIGKRDPSEDEEVMEHIILEKFYINLDNEGGQLFSQTVAQLQLPKKSKPSKVLNYVIA